MCNSDNRLMRLFFITLCLFFSVVLSAFALEPLTLKLTQTIDIADDIETARFCTHTALDTQSRTVGLMFQKDLPERGGMIFDFGRNQLTSMWMRNTILPLDMLFISDERIIVKIAENTTPYSLDIISSDVPARYVLEVNAGISKKLSLAVGDKVIFGNNQCSPET